MGRTASPDWRQIERENEGLTVRTARGLGEGWSSRVYVVNNELVIKCPKRSKDWLELDREVSFLRWASDKLPLRVPQYLRLAPHSPAAPNGYAVYQFVAGAPMDIDILTPELRAAAADRIAGFLQRLHSLRPSDELACILPPHPNRREEAETCLARVKVDLLPTLTKSEAQTLLKRFGAFFEIANSSSVQPVVLHADFSREHILGENDTVTGVIDFGDVSWGDADYDFHYLMLDFGESFAMEVARRYGHPNVDRLLTAIRYYAVVDQIETVLDHAGLALPGQVDAARRRVQQLLRSPEVAS